MRTQTQQAEQMPATAISEKQQKFIQLAQARTSRAISSIQLIGKLAHHKPFPEHVEKIVARLREEVEALETALKPQQAKAAPKFTL